MKELALKTALPNEKDIHGNTIYLYYFRKKGLMLFSAANQYIIGFYGEANHTFANKPFAYAIWNADTDEYGAMDVTLDGIKKAYLKHIESLVIASEEPLPF